MAKKGSFYSDVSELQFGPLIYPNDLNPDNFYPDCVCFTIQKRTGVSINDVTAAAGSIKDTYLKGWNGLDKQALKDYPGLDKLVRDAWKENDVGGEAKDKAGMTRQKEILQTVSTKYFADKKDPFPANMLDLLSSSLAAFGASMVGAQQRELQVGKDGTNILGSIYLNMPNGISFDEKANWAGDPLGFVGKMTKNLIGGGGGQGETAAGAMVGSAGSLVGMGIGAIPSLVSKLGLQGGMFGAAIGAVAAGSPIQKGAEAALGIAQNPYMEMMFSGIGFRTFQFEFIMRPKSETEVDEVAEILRMFRTFTRPTYTESGLGKSFMDYPMQFKIEFLTAGDYSGGGMAAVRGKQHDIKSNSYVTNPFVPKLKPCVCDSVTSNYTPQSIWAAHKDGVPVAVTLGLSFQETELVMAEDVHGDNY